MQKVKTLFYISICQLLSAIAFQFFQVNYNLPPMGFGGLAVCLNVILDWDVSVTIMIINIIVCLFALIKMPKTYVLWILFNMTLFSFYIKLLSTFNINEYFTLNILAVVLISAVLQGIAFGVILSLGVPYGPEGIFVIFFKEKFNIKENIVINFINIVVLTMSLVYTEYKHILLSIIISLITAQITKHLVSCKKEGVRNAK